MKTKNRSAWLIVLIFAITLSPWARQPAAAAPPEGPKPTRGPIVNIAADGMVGCLVPPLAIDGTHSKEELTAAYRKTVDYYAQAGAPTLFFNVCYMRAACPSEVWDTYWDIDDPEANATGWPRAHWLVHKKGVDPFAVCVARCRELGVSPWMSMRMNDTHYADDPTKTAKLWQEHPELRRTPAGGYDFARKEVRDHYLAFVEELMDRYDCDGVELDWMRFPWHFKPGEEQAGRAALNGFMRRAHELARQATARRGHPVRIAARIPAVPQFAQGLGMDGVAWAREGWVDVLILASVWRPSDTDIPIERWRERIGPAADRVLLAAGTDLWLQGVPGGKLMSNDLESQRGFTAAMLDRGADLVYLFNHFNVTDFRRTQKTPDGRTVEQNEHTALLRAAGSLEAALEGPRRHVLTFHDPPGPNMPNPRQLPAELSACKETSRGLSQFSRSENGTVPLPNPPEKAAEFLLYTGPKPAGGRVVLRVGLDDLPGAAEATLSARLNGAECRPIKDLAGPPAREPYTHDPHRVFHVAHVARRIVQFQAPLESIERGYNRVDLRLTTGGGQKVIWLEMVVEP